MQRFLCAYITSHKLLHLRGQCHKLNSCSYAKKVKFLICTARDLRLIYYFSGLFINGGSCLPDKENQIFTC